MTDLTPPCHFCQYQDQAGKGQISAMDTSAEIVVEFRPASKLADFELMLRHFELIEDGKSNTRQFAAIEKEITQREATRGINLRWI